MISDKFILHGLNKQVNQRARECLHCQAAKVKTHVHAPLNNFNGPEKRFSYIIVDMCTSPESPMGSKVWYTTGHNLDDLGSQFPSALWSSIYHQLGVQRHRTLAYHLQANGLVERFIEQ